MTLRAFLYSISHSIVVSYQGCPNITLLSDLHALLHVRARCTSMLYDCCLYLVLTRSIFAKQVQAQRRDLFFLQHGKIDMLFSFCPGGVVSGHLYRPFVFQLRQDHPHFGAASQQERGGGSGFHSVCGEDSSISFVALLFRLVRLRCRLVHDSPCFDPPWSSFSRDITEVRCSIRCLSAVLLVYVGIVHVLRFILVCFLTHDPCLLYMRKGRPGHTRLRLRAGVFDRLFRFSFVGLHYSGILVARGCSGGC